MTRGARQAGAARPTATPAATVALVAGIVAAMATGMVAAGCTRAPTHGAASADTLDVVVLVEVHRSEASTDTLVTFIAPDRVRVSHRGGDAILDASRDRFLLLDPATRTAREAPLSAWEARIRAAARAARAGADSAAGAAGTASPPLRFEAAGDGGVVAGYACRRHHLYAERPLFPGEWEEVEQEIWVTDGLDLPAGAVATYRRVFESLDWIDFDAQVERPPGVRMRLVHSHRPRGGGAAETEVETTEVVRVERRHAAATTFEVPAGWDKTAALRD